MSKDYPKPVENGELDTVVVTEMSKNTKMPKHEFWLTLQNKWLIDYSDVVAQEKAKWGQIVLEDVIGPDYFFTDDAMPTEAEKVTQASLNRPLERQRQALAKLLDKENTK